MVFAPVRGRAPVTALLRIPYRPERLRWAVSSVEHDDRQATDTTGAQAGESAGSSASLSARLRSASSSSS